MKQKSGDLHFLSEAVSTFSVLKYDNENLGW